MIDWSRRHPILALAAAAFVGSVLWSMWVDELAPRRADGAGAVALGAAGLASVLVGVGIIVSALPAAFRGWSQMMGDPDVQARIASIRAGGDVRAARRENVRAWGRAFGPALGRIVAGFAVLAVGGWLLNR